MFRRFVSHRFFSIFKVKKTKFLAFLSVALTLPILLSLAVHLEFSNEFHGIYLLKCNRGLLFDLRNDLLLGEENRLLAKIEFEPFLTFFGRAPLHPKGPYLEYSWNKKNGSGYIFNHNADGTQLLTCFSRFLDSQGEVPRGLFLGGGLPYSKHNDIELTMSATGMAHFDGKDWHHLWCNANETIASGPDDKHDPSTWKFLGSKVLFSSREKLILRSSHLVPFNNTSLRIDRYAVFHAGENHFLMLVNIANVGPYPTQYFYVYGDEPWVGEFGSSAGNVGWTRDKMYYYEGAVDPQTNSYAGMYDKGNPLILGEKKKYSGVANFIEWMGDTKPNLVYFSNREGEFAEEKERVPLHSKDNRVIFLQWGPRPLMPNGQELIAMAIGMAKPGPGAEFPVKPDVVIDSNDLSIIDSDISGSIKFN